MLSVLSFRIRFLILYAVRFASSNLCSFLCFCLSLNKASSSGERVLSGDWMSFLFEMRFGGCFHGVYEREYLIVDSVLMCGVLVWRVVGCHAGFDLLIVLYNLFFCYFFRAFPNVGFIFLRVSMF